jgi:tRNA 2-selenouridine synthase
MNSDHTKITINDLPRERFDTIIDTRSPAEFADDHIPGAINCPVLSDDERARVGTIYKQVSPFEARKLGATLTARNIANTIETHFMDRPKTWRPLIYCWRGGQRSGAMQIVMREIGWNAQRLDGGYKSYRTDVLQKLETLPGQFKYIVIAGPTGSGKTRLLHALARAGAQVIDLEQMAGHKGSVLGQYPNVPQSSRKTFDTLLVSALQSFNPDRPVYIEAESNRIGIIHLPKGLVEMMRGAPCIEIAPTIAARVNFLIDDYDYFCRDPHTLIKRLNILKELRGGDTIDRWHGYINTQNWPSLVGELLTQHYDPLYARSIARDFPGVLTAPRFTANNLTDVTFNKLAVEILALI